MKIIFLDIDGVLNYNNWYVSNEYQKLQWNEDNELDIDPACAERINNICKATGAKIVISSDWRFSWYGTQLRLERGGINPDYIYDKTPERIWFAGLTGFDHSRGAEINDWLEVNKCTNYIIIDDRIDFTDEQKVNFIHVNPHIGFTDEQMEQAIIMLSKGN
jgi:hypothetical protein